MVLIVDDILLSPCKLVRWIGKELYEHAEAQMTDESAIRRQLLQLQMRLELEDLSEDDYLEQEAILMRRLDAVREYRESRGLG